MGGHAGDLLFDQLEIGDRLLELHALLGVRGGGATQALAAPVQQAPKVVRPKSSTVSAMRSPLPTWPSTFSAGTTMFSKASRPVAVPRMPHLGMRASSTLKPGMSGVTRKAVISFFLPAPAPGVRAITVSTPAMPPLVIQRFVPLRMYALPSGVGVAVVCTLLASEPASGSVRAKAASCSPLTSGGSQRRFCSSVPNSSKARMPML